MPQTTTNNLRDELYNAAKAAQAERANFASGVIGSIAIPKPNPILKPIKAPGTPPIMPPTTAPTAPPNIVPILTLKSYMQISFAAATPDQ